MEVQRKAPAELTAMEIMENGVGAGADPGDAKPFAPTRLMTLETAPQNTISLATVWMYIHSLPLSHGGAVNGRV